jgi:hypothetical protein
MAVHLNPFVRIFNANAGWLIFPHHQGRSPTHRWTREAAMAAFAKSWRRE